MSCAFDFNTNIAPGNRGCYVLRRILLKRKESGIRIVHFCGKLVAIDERIRMVEQMISYNIKNRAKIEKLSL